MPDGPHDNRLKISHLPTASVNDLLDLPMEQVMMLQEDIDELDKTAKNAKSWLQNYLDVRFGEAANIARANAGKSAGIQRLNADGHVVVADLKKSIDWDQAKLKEAADVVASWGSDVREYVKVEYSVSEAKYKAWEKRIKDVFDPARIDKTTKQSFKIETPKGK